MRFNFNVGSKISGFFREHRKGAGVSLVVGGLVVWSVMSGARAGSGGSEKSGSSAPAGGNTAAAGAAVSYTATVKSGTELFASAGSREVCGITRGEVSLTQAQIDRAPISHNGWIGPLAIGHNTNVHGAGPLAENACPPNVFVHADHVTVSGQKR